MSHPRSEQTGLIAWFTNNNVAANLLMLIIVGVGIASAFNIKKAIMPDFVSNMIQITQVYPGAAPGEVENGVILKIEEAIKDIEGIERVESVANDSVATVSIKARSGYNLSDIMDEVKIHIDGISSFPEDAEKPVITKVQMVTQALIVQLYGDIDQKAMKALSSEVKKELLNYGDISRVDIWGGRDYEISIEIPENTLRKYNLTLAQVAQIVERNSVDIPGGAIRTNNGDIMVRTMGQAYDQKQFENIVVLTTTDGAEVKLGDIAHVRDDFEELRGFAAFNGKYSIALVAYAGSDQDIIEIGDQVKEYVEKKRAELPEGVYIDHWADTTFYLNSRLTMMVKNLALGALLVLIILALFIEMEIAFWVMVGMPVVFLGSLALMPMVDVSINMISLFGFILVLGIVVDDAIIIGESVHDETEINGFSIDAVITGAKKVAMPATFGVLTTIVAFSPTLFITGSLANFPKACGYVVVFCLIFSMIESKWILPSHLAKTREPFWQALLHWRWLDRLQKYNNRNLQSFVMKQYKPFLELCIAYRYTTCASFIAMAILIAGLMGSGMVSYIMSPEVPNDFIVAEVEMNEGTAEDVTLGIIKEMNQSIQRINERYKEETGHTEGFIKHNFSFGQGGLYGMTMMELTKNEERSMDSNQIVEAWRKELGDIPGAAILSVSAADEAGPPIAFNLVGNDINNLNAVAKKLVEQLKEYDGVYDIRNSSRDKVDEIHIKTTALAQSLGITEADLGQQIRYAFHGAEVQRIQRQTDEVKIMVRYPRDERRSITNLQSMYIYTAEGKQIPFSSVAELTVKPGYAKITRINNELSVLITASVNEDIIEPSRVISELNAKFFKEMAAEYPGVSSKLDAGAKDAKDMESQLFIGFSLALFGIFVLLAIPLRSYLQPIIIMSVIPFGIIGAVVGHWLLGYTVSMMSIFGIIALAGVVVNDSLIMVDFTNRAREEGKSLMEAVIGSGTVRFRAILLTSLTTFIGLVPMLLERSVQAQMMIPMAVSLAFGILFATVITLLLIPCMYIILDDIGKFTHYLGQKIKYFFMNGPSTNKP